MCAVPFDWRFVKSAAMFAALRKSQSWLEAGNCFISVP